MPPSLILIGIATSRKAKRTARISERPRTPRKTDCADAHDRKLFLRQQHAEAGGAHHCGRSYRSVGPNRHLLWRKGQACVGVGAGPRRGIPVRVLTETRAWPPIAEQDQVVRCDTPMTAGHRSPSSLRADFKRPEIGVRSPGKSAFRPGKTSSRAFHVQGCENNRPRADFNGVRSHEVVDCCRREAGADRPNLDRGAFQFHGNR